jgi:hypothetical protein
MPVSFVVFAVEKRHCEPTAPTAPTVIHLQARSSPSHLLPDFFSFVSYSNLLTLPTPQPRAEFHKILALDRIASYKQYN